MNSYKTFDMISLFLKKNHNIDQLITFNGRFPSAKSGILAAKKYQLNYTTFDLNRGYNHYEFNNVSLHSINATTVRCLDLYKVSIENANLTAENFYNNKINNKFTYEEAYTKTQNISYEHLGLKQKCFVSVFTSSDDEYRFLGNEWGDVNLVDQIEEIIFLSKLVAPKVVVVRMHPNQYSMSSKELKKYKNLNNIDNIRLILPKSKVKTYDLLFDCEFAVTFCSLLGPEAAYWGINLLTIGPSPYMELKIGKNIASLKNYKKLPSLDVSKAKSKIGAIKWANFLMNWKDDLNDYSKDDKGKHYICGRNYPFRPKNIMFYLCKFEIKLSKVGSSKTLLLKEIYLKLIGLVSGRIVGDHEILK